jgi:Ser/Thr protein kinase RdoA (MazF antagonist)
MNSVVERCVGAPMVFEELKHKPGRRLTLRARGPRGSAIVKIYQSDRVARVAERISSLADGPAEPEIASVLAVDVAERVLVLSDLAGAPLREAVLEADESECRRAGAAIASWHRAWAAERPAALSEHTIEDELAVLVDRAALAPREIGARVAEAVPGLRDAWMPETVVHRDLYEEQVLLGERVGMIDLDDVALGPPELDVGNLVAHLDLLELRTSRSLASSKEAWIEGYEDVGTLDPDLLDRCRTLARLRLACIHHEPRLLGRSDVPVPADA